MFCFGLFMSILKKAVFSTELSECAVVHCFEIIPVLSLLNVIALTWGSCLDV